MAKKSREFQVLVKPYGPKCNMDCSYCYYLDKEDLFPKNSDFKMSDILLEEYIIQHLKASTEEVITFNWHGGEPLAAGIDFFMKAVEYQNRYYPKNRQIINVIQTNGTLLDERWCRFFSAEEFVVGISLDGPREFHDLYRMNARRESTFELTMNGYQLLQQFEIPTEILCVVHAGNVLAPIEVYNYFKQLKASYIAFYPLVEQEKGSPTGVSERTATAEEFGDFLIAVFDDWKLKDKGKIKVQVFEEATRIAFGQDHSLCIFKTTCGGVPVVEHNGDFFSCDHYVNDLNRLGNILETPLVELLESQEQLAFGRAKLGTLPRYCLECGVRSMCGGECPKNRFIQTPGGEEGLNYLCQGYKKFFYHCRPFVLEVANSWHQQKRR